MAEAPAHRFGQIIGSAVELAFGSALAKFADQHGLYLDSKGLRPARPGKRVTWCDSRGNSHDLDYVLERGGTPTKLGLPVAFIEIAWRRYTKHSKNKVQEIEGAVSPLLTTWAHVKPFAGAVLAGTWTEKALDQLQSNGFSILHIPHATVAEVFEAWNIDVSYDEGTPDHALEDQINQWKKLDEGECEQLGDELRYAISNELKAFIDELSRSILRRIERVSILPLHGQMTQCHDIETAIAFISSYSPANSAVSLVRFEVIVRYDNGDRITADFASAADAVSFLGSFK